MADTLSPEERSRRMSLIRSRNTSPELALRQALHSRGLRYRLNDKRLPGKPDLVFKRFGVVVFVHGCFWHRHEGCSVANIPKSNTSFWLEKFERNVQRDAKVQSDLKERGWIVWTVWECELNTRAKIEGTADRIKALLLKVKTESVV
ncbi:very short patch repair endonuclease [Mesorhizobium sp.]|uniref:very short patch repair endonuclease n=1 Tax=Mesorhizobium sp. TaxID=1871066 RepID=UPI0012131A30|nr:very short patch repair endonuclease [Mesorhizobium sp.]TIL66187.1 MAG: DNA mismatch endonuclease Vsr [Mesorhizobium sp.]